jgi:hypothetical protein
MKKESVTVLRNNLLAFVAYTLISSVLKEKGILILTLCMLFHIFYCIKKGLEDDHGTFGAYMICMLIVLLIGFGTCVYLGEA